MVLVHHLVQALVVVTVQDHAEALVLLDVQDAQDVETLVHQVVLDAVAVLDVLMFVLVDVEEVALAVVQMFVMAVVVLALMVVVDVQKNVTQFVTFLVAMDA